MFTRRFLSPPMSKAVLISMGSGNMIVEFFSAEMELRVCSKCGWWMTVSVAHTLYLEVSELQRRGGLGDGVGSLLQCSAGLLLALRRDHLVVTIIISIIFTLRNVPIITLALASLVASASAAMARWRFLGSLTSLISTLSTCTPQGSVASSCNNNNQTYR